MAFDIKLQYNSSPNNKVDKSVNDILTVTGTLKNECSILDPVILIECNLTDVKNSNYMTIAAFGRKYFINNIVSVRENLVEIHAHVDVLSTYAGDIRGSQGIIKRQENRYNLLLNDGSLKTYQNPILRVKEFPSSFKSAEEFVLAVAGS